MIDSRSTTFAVVVRYSMATAFLFLLCKPALLHAQEKKTIRLVIASLAWEAELPIRVALAKGYFREQGLTIEPIFILGGPTGMAALISGDADFARIGGAQAAIRARARNVDVSIIGTVSNNVAYVVIGSKGMKSVTDLKKKVIGVTGAGAFSDFAMRLFLKNNNVNPDKDVTLRPVGNTTMRAAALETGLIAAAPFSPVDAVRLMDSGLPLIANLNESLAIPQNMFITRGEVLEKYPETSRRFLKAVALGIQVATKNKKEAIQAGYAAGLKGDPDVVSKAYDLYIPGYTSDLTIAVDGLQLMLEEDIRSGIVDKKMTVDRVINNRILKQVKEELKREGRLTPVR
jgi:ABC-type nitrate/sulfonate/bicarbonate transport system substrate-binding protein